MSAPQIRVETLCADYRVRELSESDVPEVLKLYKGNPIYFEHCPPAPSKDSVREDMHALPNGKTAQDKYFVGFFDTIIPSINIFFFILTYCINTNFFNNINSFSYNMH